MTIQKSHHVVPNPQEVNELLFVEGRVEDVLNFVNIYR